MEICIVILIILVVIILGMYNGLVKAKKKVEQAESTIDVYLTQRFNLIPNLVECVKSYTQHESSLFEKVVEMRTNYMKTKDMAEAEKLNSECNKLIAYIENYPELKASKQYLLLQQKLTKIESQLQAARRLYNGEVTRYNTKITVFPTNIIAGMFNFKEEKLFELEDEITRNNVNIEL